MRKKSLVSLQPWIEAPLDAASSFWVPWHLLQLRMAKAKSRLELRSIEMQKVKMQSGQEKPLELHKMYRILVSPVRPENMDWPSVFPELLYLIETREVAQPAA